ncbi:MAG: ABC transporter ATP-binding protein [Pseudomonadota bacterium]
MNSTVRPERAARKPGLMSLLRPYRQWVLALVLLTVMANGLNLVLPKLIASAIDSATAGDFALSSTIMEFGAFAIGIFLLTYLQSIVQTVTSERVARDLRTRLIGRISQQDHAYVQEVGAAKLLTNLTSDVDAIKNFVSQAIASIISSLFLIIGASVLLVMIDWKLAIAVLVVVPAIAFTFYSVLSRVRKLFRRSQETIDWLNKVINESINGSSLIRLLNSQAVEYVKFLAANTESRDIGMRIVGLFAIMIPAISFLVSLAILMILAFGGHLVITGELSLGNFSAFLNYLTILVFPIIVIGFMSNIIAQATASFGRIVQVLEAPERPAPGTLDIELRGDIAVSDVTVAYGEKKALRDVSIKINAGSRTAIIGPTAAGKTQLLYAITGLIKPQSGAITIDDHPLAAYAPQALHRQIGFVFQDSALFNLTLRENIAFSKTVGDAELALALATAELKDFVGTLDKGLDTIVSERGTSLSGGQKQRIMLARALALNPKILLLDDFTARVDGQTEQKILANVRNNYPGITLVSVTQKIAPVEDYDQIILLMEGMVLASGTHEELMATSPEYVQIYSSQHSTEDYELQA